MLLSQTIYRRIESCLKELSDINFQKRVWVKGEGPEMSSYTEVVCQLFDDTGIGDKLNEKQDEIVLSEELDAILRELSSILDSIDYRMVASDILNHPDWPKVVRLSSRAVEMMNKFSYDQFGSLEII